MKFHAKFVIESPNPVQEKIAPVVIERAGQASEIVQVASDVSIVIDVTWCAQIVGLTFSIRLNRGLAMFTNSWQFLTLLEYYLTWYLYCQRLSDLCNLWYERTKLKLFKAGYMKQHQLEKKPLNKSGCPPAVPLVSFGDVRNSSLKNPDGPRPRHNCHRLDPSLLIRNQFVLKPSM